MREIKLRTSQRPRPLPPGRWAMTQRWNDLLFAHWQAAPGVVARLLPEGLKVDTFQGSAWLGVVPFWMDRIKIRGVPPIPGARSFPELNLRTYVRDKHTGVQGVFFFSLDASNLLAVAAARTFYHLPYFWAEMRIEQQSEREFAFYSSRRFARQPVIFKARYRGLGPTRRLAESHSGSLEYFLTERYYLFAQNRGESWSGPAFTMYPGRWKMQRRILNATISPKPLESSFQTRFRCCITLVGWPSMCGPPNWCDLPCRRAERLWWSPLQGKREQNRSPVLRMTHGLQLPDLRRHIRHRHLRFGFEYSSRVAHRVKHQISHGLCLRQCRGRQNRAQIKHRRLNPRRRNRFDRLFFLEFRVCLNLARRCKCRSYPLHKLGWQR